MNRNKTMILSVLIITSIFAVFGSILFLETETSPEIEYRELKWDWNGPEHIVYGEQLRFTVIHMMNECDETFVARIVNLDRSQTIWEHSTSPNCIKINGGKISRQNYHIDTATEIKHPGDYILIVDPGHKGHGSLSSRLTIDVPEEQKVIVKIPKGSSNSELGKNFEPETIRVVIGVNNTVTWINEDTVPSSIVSDNYGRTGFGSPHLLPEDSWMHTFTESGVYEYHSNPHPWKYGKIIVEP